MTWIRRCWFISVIQGFTKRCRLSRLTNSVLVYETKWGEGGVAGFSQWVQLCTGDQINFGDLTPCLTYGVTTHCKEQRDGRCLTRVLTHAFLAWSSSWQCFVYIWYENISNSSWICQKLAPEQLQTRSSSTVRQGRRHEPSINYKITPCWVTLLQSARRTAV